MLEVVKVRRMGNSVIITLPKALLQNSQLKAGDRVVLHSGLKPHTITITKEK